MNTAEIIDYAAQHDIHLEANGERLRVDAPKSKMTVELRNILKTHKHELLAMFELEAIAKRHGLSLTQLQEVAGDDWDIVENDLDLADAFAAAISTRLTRERGEVPASYTSTTECTATTARAGLN